MIYGSGMAHRGEESRGIGDGSNAHNGVAAGVSTAGREIHDILGVCAGRVRTPKLHTTQATQPSRELHYVIDDLMAVCMVVLK